MTKEWSKFIQPPTYLKATRQAYLNNEFSAFTARICGVFDGSHVLEVGCGTGCFSKFLSESVQNVTFVGIDIDKKLLDNGLDVIGDNTIEYIEASAYSLPFKEKSFDAVFCHTFFNCVSDPPAAMREMKRVVKKGGPITSVTSMSMGYETWYKGDYPDDCKWRYEIDVYTNDMVAAMEKLKLGPFSNNLGYPASKMPSFFSQSGLKDISIYPLSRAFSLSNGTMSVEEKKEYITNIYLGDIERLNGAMEIGEFLLLFPVEKCILYREALQKRYDFWIHHLHDNTIWDWFGSSSLIVKGLCE